MRIIDLGSEDEKAIQECAALLVDAFASSAGWPDMQSALEEVRESLETGRISRIVDVDLPQPRTVETRELDRYFEHVTAVREALRRHEGSGHPPDPVPVHGCCGSSRHGRPRFGHPRGTPAKLNGRRPPSTARHSRPRGVQGLAADPATAELSASRTRVMQVRRTPPIQPC